MTAKAAPSTVRAGKRTWIPWEEVLERDLRQDPRFRAYWERTAVARAVAIEVIGYRSKYRLTQAALARKLGVSQPYVARLEDGEHSPRIETLRKLSDALGLAFAIEVRPHREAHLRAL